MKISKLLWLFALALVTSFTVEAQNFAGLDKSPMDVAAYPSSYRTSNKLIKVIYSRPQLKGRSLDKLAPNGKVWRTGANEAAEIIFYADMKLGGKTVKAGTYSLFTVPGEREWEIILSSDLNVWGAYSYNKANDVVRVKAPISKGGESLEAFSIAFEEVKDGVTMHLGWDTTRVAVPLSK
ncbi:DUF2911 domain-containing protein [Winogradskyella sp. 3972H.M.0a.05]|uniref:DUF2911 domain-containing protein n=1 Tax=Winogradskyella sp. 3972H.M.0a.05 TaxID=2950277 RepID=UPI0033938E17